MGLTGGFYFVGQSNGPDSEREKLLRIEWAILRPKQDLSAVPKLPGMESDPAF
jgi:hypothetical protein